MVGRAYLIGGLAALAVATAASAELGGAAASVEADRARMGARLQSRALAGYTRHELTRGNGGAVHEFANARGQVFAVAWSGPGKPDLRTLLGRRFAALAGGRGGDRRFARGPRRPLVVDQSDLRVEATGHMGWFRGVAFVPSLAPAGFAPAALAEGL